MTTERLLCQRVGCPNVAITQFSDGRGDVFWLCEEHGDALAIGFPVRPAAAVLDKGEPEPPAEPEWWDSVPMPSEPEGEQTDDH